MTTPKYFTSSALSVSLACIVASAPLSAADPNVLAEKTRVLNGTPYTFTKFIDTKGTVHEKITDVSGRPTPEWALPKTPAIQIDPRLSEQMQRLRWLGPVATTFRVNIALDLGETEVLEPAEQGGAEVMNGLTIQRQLHGQLLTAEQFEAEVQRSELAQRKRRLEAQQILGRRLATWAQRFGVADHGDIGAAIREGRSSVSLSLTAAQIQAMLKANDGSIRGIELYEAPEDDINQAMVDTSISTYALPFSSTRGSGIGVYMTESGCANESRITNYDRLSGSETNHSRNVGAIIRAVSPNSFLYCRGGAVLPQNSDLDGVGGNPAIYIVTRSNSTNDNTNYTTLDRDWDNFVYNKNVAVFNSGGNTGNGTGNVRSPGKGLNIVTVGNYNDANDTINSSSPFKDPETGNDKPEVTAPGTNITAGGFTMSGTSQSTPHAAAFSADMMSASTYLKNRPYLLKAKLLAGATDPISGGYDKVGLGGIDFLSAQWSGYYQWYSGGNSAFDYFDQNDGSNDGYVEKKIYISSSWNKVRVVLSWLTRGSYTYDHRNDAHPIGMDLDLTVYDPNGSYKGGSFSWDNPYERVNFAPTVSGYYTFKIRRYANRDTSQKLGMGLYVNYYN